MPTAKYDKRTVDRFVDKGVFKRAEVDSYLKALPDEEKNASWVEMEVDAEDMDGADGLDDSEESEAGA